MQSVHVQFTVGVRSLLTSPTPCCRQSAGRHLFLPFEIEYLRSDHSHACATIVRPLGSMLVDRRGRADFLRQRNDDGRGGSRGSACTTFSGRSMATLYRSQSVVCVRSSSNRVLDSEACFFLVSCVSTRICVTHASVVQRDKVVAAEEALEWRNTACIPSLFPPR